MCTLPREERSERCLYGLPGTQQRFLWLLGKGQGAAQQWAGGAVCSAWWCWHRFGHHSWSMRTSLAEPHPYKPPNPISAFLSSLHKAAVEVPRFLKESLRVFFQSPRKHCSETWHSPCSVAVPSGNQQSPACPLLTFQGWEQCLCAGSSMLGK